MNDHNKKLEPTRFDLGDSPSATEPAEKRQNTSKNESVSTGDSQKTLIFAFGGLVLVGLLVFLWLPTLVSEPEVEIAAPTATAERKLSGPQISPWSDAQLQRQRKEAQDILALLLEEQFALEEIGVEQWAAEEFTAALALATEGDTLYRQQEFLSAKETYQAGLDAMLELSAKVPEIFETHLKQGLLALENGEPEDAINHLQLAQLIRPDSGEVAHALGRAINLQPVLDLMAQAETARSNSDLDLAARLLEEARALDPEHRQVLAELNQVKRDIARRNFNRAMTAGYDALDKEDFDEAERQFLAAQRIMPGAGETDAAIAEARNGRTRSQIDRLAGKAAAAEGSENWSQAIKDYQAILNIDETVVFARSGMIRSKTRAELDQRLQQIIDQPSRLQDQAVYNRAQQTWREAASLGDAGPRLKRQLEAVREQLALASTPIPVLLESDEMTDVTVYRVAKLGSFRRQQLELKPGTYTAVGVRPGFRDVRRQFTVSHNQASPVINIVCSEPI